MDDRTRERDLALAAQRGDRAAMESLLDALYDQIHAVCRRICGHDADDATQDALISIVRALPSFDGRAAVRTWAFRIATNAALDELRRRSRRAETRDLTDEGAWLGVPVDAGAPGVSESVGDRLDIDQALARLAPEFRAAVVLRDLVGMEYADIAATLDVPVGTVRSRIARGRRHLADHLRPDSITGNRSTSADVRTDET
ncbi:MAG: RNA polymerase sigma factor [Acidimicrobiales bacterium]